MRPGVPQTALLLEDLFRQAGLPEGVFTNLFVGEEQGDIAGDHRGSRISHNGPLDPGSEQAGMSVAAAARER